MIYLSQISTLLEPVDFTIHKETLMQVGHQRGEERWKIGKKQVRCFDKSQDSLTNGWQEPGVMTA